MVRFKLPAKKAIFGAILVAVAGLVAGYFLLPGEETAQQMQTMAQAQEVGTPAAPTQANIDDLKAKYDAEMATGNVAFVTVQAYVQGLQATGNIEAAVQVWCDYSVKYPDDLQGWKERASYESLTKHEEEYLETLTNIARLEPTEANLKALSDYQNYKQKFAEQKETLKQLVTLTNKQNADYLLALADVAMLEEDEPTALSALEDYFKNEAFAATRNNAKIEPYIRLLAKAGRKDEAVDQAIALTRDVKIAVVVQQQNDIVVAQAMDEDSTAGLTPPPPPPLAPAVPADESATATPAVESPVPSPVAPADTTAADAPVPPPAPPLVPGEPAATPELAAPVPPPPPPVPTQEVAPQEAAPVISEAPQDQVASPVAPEATPAPVANETPAAPGAEVVPLPSAPTEMVPDVGLQARIADVLLYEVGPDYAVRYIEAITANTADSTMPEAMQPMYARALFQQGKYEQALPMLRALSGRGGEFREWYFLALSKLAKTSKEAKADLIEFVKENFAAGDLTEDQKVDRVYALLNAGEKTLALDYTERALQAAPDAASRDKWQNLHKALTAKPKAAGRAAPRVTLEQKLQIANRPGASQDYVRRTAFEALAAGKKAEAISLFAKLALVNGPDSSDANQLMYLWGARIAGDELSWMIDIANQVQGVERNGWISKIAGTAASEDIIAIAEAYPDWLSHPEFERRYVTSLVQLGDTQTLSAYLETHTSTSQTVDMYQLVASQAGMMLDYDTQEQALKKALEIEPNNREVWLQLTSLYISRAHYIDAQDALTRAMNIDATQYGADPYTNARHALAMNYYAGALSRRDGEFALSNDYFSRAMQMPESQMFSDRDSQVKLLSVQMALGNDNLASQGFETLLEHHPGDAVLLADYMNALLDRGEYLQALDVAGRHGGEVVLDSQTAVEDAQPVLVQSLDGEMPLIQTMSGGSELKLQFPRPLPANFQVLQGESPSWVAYTSTSYDTALIVAQSGYILQANATPSGLMVSAAPASNAGSMEAMRQRYLRLQLLYSRLELETGAVDKALARLESLSPSYNETPEYRGFQANAEYYAGNMKRALNLIKRAQAQDPQNEDIAYLRRNIERFHAEHLKLDHEYQILGDHKMHITTLEARKQYNNNLEVAAQYQNNFIDTDLVRRASGALLRADGHRWRATLSLAKFMEDSSVIEGSLYANRDTPGAGLSYQFTHPFGTTQVYAQYHKPYWDVVEAVVEDTTRDRAGLWHLWRPNPKWSVRVDGGYNRYNIENENNFADSLGMQATVLRSLWDKQPYVALAYGFDGEYMLGRVQRGNGAPGVSYKLVPLRTREVHALSGIFYHDFTRDTNGELSLGYAADRLGGHGPAVEARLTHYLTDDVDLQLRTRYGLDAQETDNDALSVGGYVRWTW